MGVHGKNQTNFLIYCKFRLIIIQIVDNGILNISDAFENALGNLEINYMKVFFCVLCRFIAVFEIKSQILNNRLNK